MFSRRPRAAWMAGVLAAAIAAGALAATPANAVVGESVKDGTYAFTAKLDIGAGKRSCLGALVDAQWVLTASSCFADDPDKDFKLAAGAPKLKTTATIGRADLTTANGAVTEVVQLVPRADRDLVMARLAKPVTGITPAGIAVTAPAKGDMLSVAGYGRTKTEWVPNRLHAGAFTVDSVADTTLGISGKPNTDAAICKGDGGGPAFRETNGNAELIAVNRRSWGGGCFGEDETRTDAVGARVDDIAGWIQTVRLTTKYQDVSDVLTSADFNGDGRSDVAAVLNDGNLHAFYAKPDGTLQYGRELWRHDGSWKGYQQIIGGDFNGDGKADLIARRSDGQLFLYTGTADGKLSDRRTTWYDTSWQTMKQIVRYRADASGRDGLAAVWGDGSLHAYTTKADGTLSGNKRDLWHDKTWGGMKILATGDFNGDKRDDIVAVTHDGGLRLYTGTAKGTVSSGPTLWYDKSWDTMRAVLGGDFNGDGYDDIVARWGDRSLHLYLGNGKSTLTAGPSMWLTAS